MNYWEYNKKEKKKTFAKFPMLPPRADCIILKLHNPSQGVVGEGGGWCAALPWRRAVHRWCRPDGPVRTTPASCSPEPAAGRSAASSALASPPPAPSTQYSYRATDYTDPGDGLLMTLMMMMLIGDNYDDHHHHVWGCVGAWGEGGCMCVGVNVHECVCV